MFWFVFKKTVRVKNTGDHEDRKAKVKKTAKIKEVRVFPAGARKKR